MRPEERSRVLLAITRSKAKMFEYGLPESEHIRITRDPGRLLRLAIGMLGDLAASVSRNGTDSKRMAELSSSLRFSARYFDAYAASKLAEAREAQLLLLASAAYYLCDLPGSAGVLVSGLDPDDLDLDARGLEGLLCWLLRGNFSAPWDSTAQSRYHDDALRVSRGISEYLESGAAADHALQAASRLRQTAYAEGTPRELLFADACCAIARRRIEHSARYTLPHYSGLPVETWASAFSKPSFVKELWPSQRLLGERGVFAGTSAVVQMPTSAGKSRATEIIIRSAFLTGRASLAVVVAPFRALCREIRENLAKAFHGEEVKVNELSDVFQKDFDIDDLLGGQGIVVMTPEKLVYVLRHAPELGSHVGLLVLDEGHQFDAGTRGVTYELLVTSLKGMIPAGAQKVLISAVVSNAPEIATWLNDDGGVVVAGPGLLPTERSVAFASWQTQLGQLRFVVQEDPQQEEFFVPRVIRSTQLNLRGKETTPRFFPTKGDGRSVALYLGLRLVSKGAVAIFCGRKETARGICESVVDVFDRGLVMPQPVTVADAGETERIAYLYAQNLGAEAAATRAAGIGVFSHHGNTPHGVRLAVEHAMKEGLGRFVVCTSTLAQGVNLPIRYLIVTTARQGGEKIKVRDFHNLMGRAGRSGMHTEGSVLFANPEVYDERTTTDSSWSEYEALLRVENSEPCASTLLSVLGPLKSDGGKVELRADPLVIARHYVSDEDGSGRWVSDLATALSQRWFSADTLRRQFAERRDHFAAIESFLLAHWPEDSEEDGARVDAARDLAKRTLAYHFASSEQRGQLLELFQLLAGNVAARVTEPERRRVYGRTLFGVGDAAGLEQWVAANFQRIASCEDEVDLFTVLWECIEPRIQKGTFRKWQPPATTETFARGWLAGESFGELLRQMKAAGARIGLGPRPLRPTVEHVVEMGEDAIGFDGAHVLGAVTELVDLLMPEDDESPVDSLRGLQKRLKYGLPSGPAVLLYEAGFSDRALAIDLAAVLPGLSSRSGMTRALRRKRRDVEAVLIAYPKYFIRVFERLVGDQ